MIFFCAYVTRTAIESKKSKISDQILENISGEIYKNQFEKSLKLQNVKGK